MMKKRVKRKVFTVEPLAPLGSRILAWLSWLILVCIGAWFLYIFWSFGLFPMRWVYIAFAAYLGALLFTFLIVKAKRVGKSGKILVSILNTLMAAILLIGCLYFPEVKGKLQQLFGDVPETGKLNIDFYVLTEEARQELELPSVGEVSENIEDYRDARFVTQTTMDYDNQEYAMLYMCRDQNWETISRVPVDTLWEGVDALYTGQGDVIVVNNSYIKIIEENEDYKDFSSKVKLIYSVEKEVQLKNVKASAEMTKKPFLIFLGGEDQWGSDISLNARTDVNIVVAVNPITKNVLIATIPRDSYIPNPYLGYYNDKLTHMGMYGIDNTLSALSNYLDEEIQNYAVVNFSTFMSVIWAVGGVDIYNPYDFYYTWDPSYYFPEGNLHLDGDAALFYCQERYNLPNGDFGRNEHQSLVLNALIHKLTEPAVITKIGDILDSLAGKFVTNVESGEIYALCQMQLDDMAKWNIVNYHVQGSTGLAVCASANTQELSCVFPYEWQVQFIAEQIDLLMNGETLVQQELQ